MKKILLFVGMFYASFSYGQTVTVIASTNGIAPIPSFNLNEPAALVFLNTNITKNLEFSPDFTYDLRNGKGWFLDTWLRWNQPLDSAKRWTATVGYDWSLFFQPLQTGADEVSQSVRYPTYQAKIKFIQNKQTAFTLDYWYTYAIEKAYGVKGIYLGFTYSKSKELEHFTLSSNPQVFFISYSDGAKGFSSSVDLSLAHKESGVFISSQAMKSISVPNLKFAWNLSLGITRKLH